jgi:hypothetical protein
MSFSVEILNENENFVPRAFETFECERILPTLAINTCTLETKKGILYKCNESAQSLSLRTGIPIHMNENGGG